MKKTNKKALTIASMVFAASVATPVLVQMVSTEAEAATTVATTNLKDIKGHWGEKTIREAIEKGYVSGYTDGTFKPDQTVTNAEFVKMLTQALYPDANYTSATGEQWYQASVNEAVSKGLIKSTDFKSTYNSKMIRNDLAKLGAIATGEKATDEKKWMYLATMKGLIRGTDAKGTLKETGNMTRAEAVTVISRVFRILNGETLETDKYAISNAEIYWHKTNIFTMLPQWFKQSRMERYQVTDSKLVSKSPDGNVVSTAKKLVVIDTDDKNDPNWSLLGGYELYKYDVASDKKMYTNVKKTGGYIVVSVNDLKITDTNKLKVSRLTGAQFDVSFGNMTSQFDTIYSLVKDKKNPDTFHVKTGQAQKNYEYATGYYMPKNYKISQNEATQIYFRGILEWGGINGSLLFDAYYF